MKKEVKIILGLIIFFVCFNYFFSYLPEKKLDENFRYIVGKILNKESAGEGGLIYTYNFYYKNQTFNSSFPVKIGYEDKFKTGDKIFVKFCPEDPSLTKVEYDIKVPDKLENNIYGWKKIPL